MKHIYAALKNSRFAQVKSRLHAVSTTRNIFNVSNYLHMQNIQHNQPRQRVTVVSIGRSGTSLFARILHEVLGVDFGLEADHIPRNYNNPDGYFENAEFLAFNDRILQAAGGWVLSPPPINYMALLVPAVRTELVGEAKNLLKKYALDKPRFGWKDPRLSFTLPIWREACPEIVPIIVFRQPMSVSASIAAQLEQPIVSILPLWFQYYQHVFAHTENMPRFVVSFDDLLQNPLSVVMHMAKHLDIAPNESAVAEKLSKIVKPQQSRHTSVQNAANSTSVLDVRTQELFKYLRKITDAGLQPDALELQRLLSHD
jgi:hypothetical protein